MQAYGLEETAASSTQDSAPLQRRNLKRHISDVSVDEQGFPRMLLGSPPQKQKTNQQAAPSNLPDAAKHPAAGMLGSSLKLPDAKKNSKQHHQTCQMQQTIKQQTCLVHHQNCQMQQNSKQHQLNCLVQQSSK